MKPEWENKEQPISNEDLQILERAREILSDESKWNSDDDRVCNDDDRKWSLFSAIKKLFKGRKIDKDPKIQSNIKKMNDNFESIEKSLQNIENRLEKEHGVKARKVKLPRLTSNDFFK